MGLRCADKLSLLDRRSLSKHACCRVDKGRGKFSQARRHFVGVLLVALASRRQEPQCDAKSGDGSGLWMARTRENDGAPQGEF
jgi:hypothetical protein